MAEAGLLVSIGDPSSCDTPAAAGSEFSTMSGLREAVKVTKSFTVRAKKLSGHLNAL